MLGSFSYLGWSFSSYTLAACLPVSTRVIQINKELLTVSSYWHISFPLTVSSLASVDLFGVHFLSYVLALHFHEPIAFLPAIWILFSRNSTLLLFPVISQLLPCEASLACWEEQPCPRVSIGHRAYCSLVACQASSQVIFSKQLFYCVGYLDSDHRPESPCLMSSFLQHFLEGKLFQEDY